MKRVLRFGGVHALLACLVVGPEILLSRQVGGNAQIAALALSVLVFAFPPALFFLALNRYAMAWALWLMIAAALVLIQAAKYRFLQSPLFLTDFFPATLKTTLGVLPGLSLGIQLLAVLLVLGLVLGSFFLLWRLGKRSARAPIVLRLCLVLFYGALPLTLITVNESNYERVLPALGASASDFSRPFSINRMGFMGSLWHDVRYLLGQDKPVNYSKEAMQRIRQSYRPAASDATGGSPSVIVLLLESFWDPLAYAELGVSPDPIPYFRSLAKKFPHGRVRVPMYGGGTALAEFEILTALSTALIRGYPYVNLRRKIPTLATTFAQTGSKTTFLHGYKHWFYARDRAVPLMGFERFLYRDQIYAAFPGTDIEDFRYIKDEFFMRMLAGLTRERPFFIFASSYGTHGPYINEKEIYPYRLNSALPEKTRDALEANLMLLKAADDSLRYLVAEVAKSREETLIFAFGDHVPNESYIHLDLRRYDKEKPFWLPYLLVHSNPSNTKAEYRDLDATAVADFLLRQAGLHSPAQFAAARENPGIAPLLVYDILFGEQVLAEKY